MGVWNASSRTFFLRHHQSGARHFSWELRSGKIVEVEVEDLPPTYRESALVCLKRNLPLNALLRDFTDEIDRQAARVR